MKKTDIFARIVILSALAIFFAGINCIAETPKSRSHWPEISRPKESKEVIFKPDISNGQIIEKIVQASNSFGLAIYRRIGSEKGNHFLSPLSLSLALSMVLEGARGETAKDMVRVLNLPEDASIRQAGFMEMQKLINQPGRKSELRLANAIWIQENFEILKSYLDVIARIYGGQATNVDFLSQREQARKMINEWTEEKTAGRIKDVIPPGIINNLTRVILTNAIYFRGLWLLPFNPEFTRPEKFYLPDGQEIEVPMMRFLGDRARFPYMENEEVQMLEMLYEGRDISMLILLPRQRTLTALEDKLDFEIIKEWEKNLKEERVDVYLPRFKMETKYFLKEKLKAMGLGLAFSSKADFSGINGLRDLFIQQVIHQAYVEVNEEGTEAAAATGVLIGRTAYVPEKRYVFRADHPFIFMIREKTSGAILFLGRLCDPRSG